MVGAIAISGLLAATLIFVYLREITAIVNKLRERYLARKVANKTEDYEPETTHETKEPPTAEELEQPIIDEGNAPIEIPPVHSTPVTPEQVPQQPQPVIAEKNTEQEPELLPVNALFNTENEPKTVPHIADAMASKNEITLVEEPNFKVSSNIIEEGVESDSTLYDPTAELSRYHRPGLDLLIERKNKSVSVDLEEQEENKARIIKTLHDYGIGIAHIEAKVGPTVTLYEIIPSEGTRIAKIKRLEDDIALSLAALGIRIIAPIPGKGTVGIEVPNKDPQTVSIRSVLGSKAFIDCKYELPMAMGATISNEVYIADLAKMPHLLVAGATGQGKSVGLNTIIASLLYKRHPAELKFVLVDPKMVEFSLYSSLQSHFMAQLPDEDDAVVTDMGKVERTLNSLCVEMDNRYDLLRDANVRTLKEYNEKFINRRLNPEKGHRFLPYIVIIVDEFADLIMTSGKAIETPIARIAQKARAVGMHMIIATQRPSTNVITGIIKANFPGRIAFRVSQMVDSKTILDRPGANQLIGRGDMLFSHNGSMERVQCAFIDTPEVEAMVNFIADQPGYEHPYFLPEPKMNEGEISVGNLTDRDPLFEDAARYLCSTGDTASTSSLQRRFSIGYNRAGKIMDQLEAAGIVGPTQGSKPRALLIDLMQLDQMIGT
ncbi:MAG: DNA translocase FtsK [Muribaculaceae bacterium]|nr:DNA translocase FtsK [Muribaculaceae bacterium]